MSRVIIGILIALVVLVIGYTLVRRFSRTQPSVLGINTASPSPSPSPTENFSSSKILFSTSQYAGQAELIYPGPLTEQAQQAVADFTVVTLQGNNGSTIINISMPDRSEGQQTYTLRPGDKLYFINNPNTQDMSQTYNYGIVVDTGGYIVATGE